jgi:hypothetical protein
MANMKAGHLRRIVDRKDALCGLYFCKFCPETGLVVMHGRIKNKLKTGEYMLLINDGELIVPARIVTSDTVTHFTNFFELRAAMVSLPNRFGFYLKSFVEPEENREGMH